MMDRLRAASSRGALATALLAGSLALWACGSDTNEATAGSGASEGAGASPATSGSAASGPGSGAAGPGSGPGGAGAAGASGPGSGGSGATGGSGVGGSVDCGPSASGPTPNLKLTPVASGLDQPVLALGSPGDSGRLFIVEQTGKIRILSGGAVLPAPFLDVSSIIYQPPGTGDERGLLGLAFHPDYQQNGRFFVFYTAKLPNSNEPNLVVEYQRSASDPNLADPQPVQQILSIGTDAVNHNGGMLAFGPDGMMYVSHGEGGDESKGQTIDDKFGNLLRVDVDTFPSPPAGNYPGGDPFLWDYGLRNPWRFSFDRCAGDIYIGDVGGDFEEVNVEPMGQGHKNYGWNLCSGMGCPGAITLPVVAFDHGNSDCAVIGGFVYRGSLIPGMAGRYLYGDYCSNRIHSFVWSGGVATEQEDLSDNLGTNVLGATSSFGEDESGNVYVLDLAGTVYRIDPE